MSIKYQCPFCDKVYEDEYEAEDCMKECVFDTYSVIEIDTSKDIKANIEEFVGKCETCRNCDMDGNTFVSCPHKGCNRMPDGCDGYAPDTLTFGPLVETLWHELKEARV